MKGPVMNSSWIPDEPHATLMAERTWLAGMGLTATGYGIVVVLYVLCARLLIKKVLAKKNVLNSSCLLAYITCIFIFGTLFNAIIMRMTQLSFIDFRNYPGGPSAFENDMFSIPVDDVSNATFVLANWFADGLVVWRCTVMYRNCRFPSWIVIGLPVLTYLSSFTMGVLWLVQVSAPNSSPWLPGNSINFTEPYFWLSLSLNITMTIAIVSRLLFFRWRISSALGPTYGSQYTSIAAMLIESAFLYSSFSLLFLVPFAVGHPVQNTFVQALGEVQIIAPLLIIYRVASGSAWSNTTMTQLKTLKSETIRLSNRVHNSSNNSLSFPSKNAGSYQVQVNTEIAMKADDMA